MIENLKNISYFKTNKTIIKCRTISSDCKKFITDVLCLFQCIKRNIFLYLIASNLLQHIDPKLYTL